jgi:hypothetical protein
MASRRIDDHSFFAGKAEHGSVFPDGSHKLKMERDDGHAGSISDYPDTTEAIERDQESGVKAIHRQPMKTGYRY